MSYQYDVFISYRRQQPVLDWVANHLHPMLEQWLPQHLPWGKVSIFRDSSIEVGSRWPDRLSQSLRQSRCLVAVWSPPYFQSAWCMAEWGSMEERERLLGYYSAAKPSGLAWPVVFADGIHFPAFVKHREWRDFHLWNHPYASFRETAKYLEFDSEVQRFAQELAAAIASVPEWREDFPVLYPASQLNAPLISLPRM
jgi:hypothetical protein